MIQYFAKREFKSVFSSNSAPRLNSISRRGTNASSTMPRVMHSHNEILEILFVSDGTGVYIVDNKRYSIQMGDIIICNINTLHDEVPEFNHIVSSYCCSISDLQLPGLQKNCLIGNGVRPVFHSGEHFDDVNNLMCMLHFHLSSNQKGSGETCHHLMIALLTIVINIISENQQKEDSDKSNQILLYEQIKKYIDLHYYEDINLNSIARAMNLSPYYLSHVFKNVAGYSPMQYALRRRIGESQTLLINSKHSITEIASQVGYGNPNYFNIIFTKKIGMSPSQYRKTYTNSVNL